MLAGADGRAAGVERAHRVEHLLAELDDREVARAEALVRAVGDRAHRDPHRDVLVREPADAGEVARLHRLAVLPEAVVLVAQRAVLRVEVDARRLVQELAPGLGLGRLRRVAPGDEVERRVRVVGRHVDVGHVVQVVRRDQHRRWRDEHRRAHVVVRRGVLDRSPDRRVAEAVRRRLHLQARCLVGRRAQPQLRRGLGAVDARGHHVRRVQARAVRRVDRAFEDLRPVARQQHLGDAHARVLGGCPRRRHELGHRVGGAEPAPHHAAPLAHRVGLVPDLVDQAAGRRLRHHLEHVAGDVHLPAVVQAAQAAFLVAAVDERGAPVRALLVEHADAAVAVAEHDEVLAEHARLDRRAVGLAHLLDQAHRQPVAPHQPAHRRVADDTAQQVVLLRGDHGASPRPRTRHLMLRRLILRGAGRRR